MKSFRRKSTRARAALLSSFLLFLALQAAFAIALDRWNPELVDPEYQLRLTTLRARKKEAPDRPILMILGSSRTALAFRPESVPSLPTSSGSNALPFNFSHYGAGPLFNLMELRRLLDDGIRPTWLVVEVMPAYYTYDNSAWLMLNAESRDYSLLCRYLPSWRLYGDYLKRCVKTAPKYPTELLRYHVPRWDGDRVSPIKGVTELGACLLLEHTVDEPTRSLRTAATRGVFGRHLASFCLSPIAERATREILALCRDNGIKVALVITPEGSTFREWYPADAYPHLIQSVTAMCEDFSVPLVDGRDWLQDQDFFDYHHVIESGAMLFTRRLTDEVLRPLVQGQTLVNKGPAKTVDGPS
jgi:hypothetical protein